MQLTICEKIVDESKFLETHLIRKNEIVFAERLELYYQLIKANK